ncbi:RNA polymerase subunit sigma-24 [Methylomonas koyamae]|uniref:RNA polymerase subunit sigma-24 n=1 Tax=Methylomonas koyamae TaxID=702114 RepID=A0A177NA76_9GAMM|nr:RNA polymerase sigma factor [Methylomonas koyamae]OAI13980.1 RNA polymerase subunit sigma-24 [Methylomonas koyamae]
MTDKMDHNLLQGWFLSYSQDIKSFFHRKVGESDAADLMQDVYLRALNCGTLATVVEPRAYLFRIAANLVVDHVRKQSIRQHDDYEAFGEQVSSRSPGPVEALSGEERLNRFRAALAELPAEQRQAFLLSRYEGMSHGEIARFMGLSDKTVQRYVAKAFDYCLNKLEG